MAGPRYFSFDLRHLDRSADLRRHALCSKCDTKVPTHTQLRGPLMPLSMHVAGERSLVTRLPGAVPLWPNGLLRCCARYGGFWVPCARLQ